MAAVPRIARAVPHGPIHRPELGIPTIARLRWAAGNDQDVPATAVAWTADAVEILWAARPGEPLRTDWIDARDVRRTLAEPEPDPSRPPTTRSLRGAGR
jgi:hypothetical protein